MRYDALGCAMTRYNALLARGGYAKIFSPILLLQVCEPLSRPGLNSALGLRRNPQQMALGSYRLQPVLQVLGSYRLLPVL